MEKRLPLYTAAILFTAAVSLRAFTYSYTENLAAPNWSNWTVTGSLSSVYYTPGGYGGLTGGFASAMTYSREFYGGGVVSMTLRIAYPNNPDTFSAYLGASPGAPFGSNYYQVSVSAGGAVNVYQFYQENQITLGGVWGLSIPDNSVVQVVGVPNPAGGGQQGSDVIGVYVNNVLVLTQPSCVGWLQLGNYYGVGVYGQDGSDGNLMSSVSLGAYDPHGPNAVPASSISASPYYTSIDLQWPAATDPNGSGIYEYSLYRNGQLVGTTQGLQYSDTAGLTPSTPYSYTLVVTDYFFNTASTTFQAITETIPTNPPYPSTTPEGRRVGVRPTGAYWGASGENIDVLSGNLSFSQPLLNARGRNGWSVNFNLIYNSQNWRKDSGGIWEFGADTGYGYGWRIMAGSITPVWNPGGMSANYYIYVDSTGAEYQLNQNNNNVWSSQQSIYVWFDANANILHNRDGSFWSFGCISASTEPDSGIMYPTLIEDSNGNQVKITYQTARGASWANSSSRIALIEDVRATNPEGVYYTYSFTYNGDSPQHLTSITNSIGTGENYSFAYYEREALADPFENQSYGTTVFLNTATITNIGTYYQFTTDGSGELTKIQLPYKGYLAYSYVTTNYGDGRSFREVHNRYLSADGSTQTTYPITHESTPGTDVHLFTYIDDPGGVGEKYWAFTASGTYEGLANTYQGRDRSTGGPGNCLSGSGNGLGACRIENDFTWIQDGAGNSNIQSTVTSLDPGAWAAQQKTTTQTLDRYGNVTQVVDYNYPASGGYTPAQRTYNYTYLNSSNYANLYIYNRLVSAAVTDGTTNLYLATLNYDCVTGCSAGGSGPPREWDTSYSSIQWRGNPTAIATVSANTTVVYDLYGNTVSTTVNGVTSNAAVTSATNYAAPSTITVGSLQNSLTYSSFLGLTNDTGPNGTSVSLGYDINARPTSSTSSFGAVTTTVYNDTASPPNTCTMVDNRWTQTNLDGFGRPILTLTGSGSSCGAGAITQAETTYGPCGCSPLGKMVSQAVPHAYGSTATATTTYTYDGIGRTTSKAVVGSETQGTTQYIYAGNIVQVNDPAGKWKLFTTDAFGNLVSVTEPNPD
jgi:hypothetical protein